MVNGELDSWRLHDHVPGAVGHRGQTPAATAASWAAGIAASSNARPGTAEGVLSRACVTPSAMKRGIPRQPGCGVRWRSRGGAQMPEHLQGVLYTAVTVVEGGREDHGRSLDGRLDADLSAPESMRGSGGSGTNSAELLAVGYAAY